MSFFDDLKKPEEKAMPPADYTFTDEQRQKIAEMLHRNIQLECTIAKKEGKRSVHGYCVWSNGEDYDYDCGFRYRKLDVSIYRTLGNKGQGRGSLYLYCSQMERDKIMTNLRRLLVADGFPADVLRPYAYNDGNFLNKKMIYCIEVDVRW